MKKFRKIFCLKFGLTKKVDALIHPQQRKIQSPEGSVKEIILKKNLIPNLAWTKKVGAQVDAWTPTPALQIQSPEHLVKEKILRILHLIFSMTKKSFLRPPSKSFRVQRFL